MIKRCRRLKHIETKPASILRAPALKGLPAMGLSGVNRFSGAAPGFSPASKMHGTAIEGFRWMHIPGTSHPIKDGIFNEIHRNS